MSKFFTAMICVSAFAVSGCAPVWVEGGRPEVGPAYGIGCDPSGTPLKCARSSIRKQFESYADQRHQIETYRQGANLTLLGLGTAAAVNTITNGSKEGLQTLGVAAGTLLGFDEVAKVFNQHKVFGAGLDALQCLMDIDTGAREAEQKLLLTRTALSEKRALLMGEIAFAKTDEGRASVKSLALPVDINRVAERDLSDAWLALEPYMRLGGAGIRVKNQVDLQGVVAREFAEAHLLAADQAEDAFGIARKSSTRTSTILLLADAHKRKLKAIESAKRLLQGAMKYRVHVATEDEDVKAAKLMSALNDIRQGVGEQLLYTHADLAGIFDKLKAAVGKAKPEEPAPEGEGDSEEIAAVLADAPADKREMFALLSAQLALAEGDKRASESARRAYEECRALAEKEGSGDPAPDGEGDEHDGDGDDE